MAQMIFVVRARLEEVKSDPAQALDLLEEMDDFRMAFMEMDFKAIFQYLTDKLSRITWENIPNSRQK